MIAKYPSGARSVAVESRTNKVSPPGARREIRLTVAVVIGIGVAVLIYAVLVGGPGINVFRSMPTFPSVESSPDPALRGTVAYNALAIGTPQGKMGCVDVISVAGGRAVQLFCADQPKAMGVDLVWLDDGRLEATDQYAARWRKIVDLTTGDITTLPGTEVATKVVKDTLTVPGPGGKRVSSAVHSGSLIVTLTTPSGSRTLLDVQVPREYSFNAMAWSPDGRWIVAEDSAARLLVISTGEHPVTRMLLDGGWGPAATDRVFAPLFK